MSHAKPQAAAVQTGAPDPQEPDPADSWKQGHQEHEEGEEAKGRQDAPGSPEDGGRGPGWIRGPKGGWLRPWTKESRPTGGRPRGIPDAWASLCGLKRSDPDLWADRICDILEHPEKYPAVYPKVLAEYGDRILGPVVKQVAKVEHRVAQSSYEVTVRQGGPAHRGDLETGQGAAVDAVQQSGVAQGGTPALLGPAGSPVTSHPPGGASGARLEPQAPPSSSGALEARLGALEGQVSQLVALMTQVLQQKQEASDE